MFSSDVYLHIYSCHEYTRKREWLNFMWLMVGDTGQQGMLTPPRHLIPPLLEPEVCVGPIFGFVFPIGFMRLLTVRNLCYFLWKIECLFWYSCHIRRHMSRYDYSTLFFRKKTVTLYKLRYHWERYIVVTIDSV
jgi:hypothetical protein